MASNRKLSLEPGTKSTKRVSEERVKGGRCHLAHLQSIKKAFISLSHCTKLLTKPFGQNGNVLVRLLSKGV